MLGDAARQLISDVFQRADLFEDLPRIRKRIVAWNGDRVELDHSAVVISEEALLSKLESNLQQQVPASWTVYCVPPLPKQVQEYRAGTRMASATPVAMKNSAEACWIESLEGGWLFLLPGWLLAVGGQTEDLLAQSRLVREQITEVIGSMAQFPASPRIVSPLAGEGWICCGSAAMAFDPLCGDGTANAVREAILASAVIRAAERGEDIASLTAHYEARLTAGFQRHLAMCRQFYSSGGDGPWWKAQLDSIEEGLAFCARRIKTPYRYQLNGFDLIRLADA
jgi:hypothetical protein